MISDAKSAAQKNNALRRKWGKPQRPAGRSTADGISIVGGNKRSETSKQPKKPKARRKRHLKKHRFKSRGGTLQLGRLWRTTAFRFTVIYVSVFTISVGLLGVFLYNSTFPVLDRRVDSIIDRDMAVLEEAFINEGPGRLRFLIADRAAWRDNGVYMLVRTPTGALLAGSLNALPKNYVDAEEDFFNFTYERDDRKELGSKPETRKARGKIRRFKTSQDAETSFLVLAARDISSQEVLRDRTRTQLMWIAAATVIVGLFLGFYFSQSLLRRVDSVNRTAQAIRGGDLSKRIKLTGANDELDHLSMNLNAMLDQIERLMSGMREVSDNIAHDLRSPLTRIRARLHDAIKRNAHEKDEILRATLEDAERMIMTFNELLSIARIESGEGAGAMEAVDLAAIADEMAELYEPAAADSGFDLTLDCRPCPAIKGSRALIAQAFANLLDNALKYAEGGRRIAIRVGPAPKGRVAFSIADDGPGIPEQERGAVLKRFVRLERSRTSNGSGLGLSLVAAIARAHNAEIILSHTIDKGYEGNRTTTGSSEKITAGSTVRDDLNGQDAVALPGERDAPHKQVQYNDSGNSVAVLEKPTAFKAPPVTPENTVPPTPTRMRHIPPHGLTVTLVFTPA
ncbi:MAG: HAMP domain-containing sensor histidine kinase [Pseudomonadota bacterium]